MCGRSYGIISSGKTLLSEAFGSTMPDIVTAGFSASFVAAMSAANLGGRVLWSNASDMLAHKLGGDPFRARRIMYGSALLAALGCRDGLTCVRPWLCLAACW